MFDINRREVTELLSELVAIDSVNPSLVPGGAGEQAVAKHILSHIQQLGLPARLDPVAEGRPNIVGALPAKGTSVNGPFETRHGLILNGHLDVVGTKGMESSPFQPRLEGNRLYGRGSFDMKGGLVMALVAMAAIVRQGLPLGRSVLFTGVVDEEYASIGTEDVARRYQADAAVVMEPTALDLCVAHKGFAWVTVETFGHAAHGSDYETGIDAITRMGRLLTAVEGMQAGFLEEEGHPLLGSPSIHASLIEGGRELSTYPDYCKSRFERRTLPGENPSGAANELKELCQDLAEEDPSFRYRVTLDFTRNGYEVERKEPVVEALSSSVEKVRGAKPAYVGTSGWLDSALLGAAGIPTVIFGPAGAGAHSAVEYVDVDSVMTGARVLAETIVSFCGRQLT